MLSRTEPVLRLARTQDVPALVAIENDAFSTDRISARSFRGLIARKTAVVFVAEIDDAIAGYALLLFRRGTAMARLYSLAVSKKSAGTGTGRILLAEAERRAFAQGRMLLRLEVHENNSRAIELYRRAGYRPIGKYLDYYDDHGAALRFEKTVRVGTPLVTDTPYYEQTTDFTCGPACVMMALAKFDPDYRLDPIKEVRLWREATTVFMMSGIGGCEPYGLGVAAHEAGLEAEIYVSQPGTLFADSVRSAEKRIVMELAQKDFRSRARTHGIIVHKKAFDPATIRKAIKKGKVAAVLVSAYHMFGKKEPHWVLVHGDDKEHMLIHDPWVEDKIGETLADAANLPVPYEQFDRMCRFGKQNLRAAVILNKRESKSQKKRESKS